MTEKKENPDKLLHFYLCQNLVLIKKITKYGTTYFTYGTMVNVNSDVIFWSTFTHGFFRHEHLFVLISSSSTFLQSQWNISTNSVSFVSPICGGGSNINKWDAETSYSWMIDECLSGITLKLTQAQAYQVKTMTVYHVKTRAMHKVSGKGIK